MSVLNKYNRGFKFDFQIGIDHEYITLRELVSQGKIDDIHTVRGLYINKKSRYGDAPVAVTETHLVNLPSHLVQDVTNMMNDEDVVNLANDSRLGFKIYEYSGKNGIGYSINWVETTPPLIGE